MSIKDMEQFGKLQQAGEIKKEAEKAIYAEAAPIIEKNEFYKTVNSRRSVRLFSEKNIPEDVMQRCLDAALLAPNSSNLQPWEFYWVRSGDKKKALVEACFSQAAAATAREIVVAVARTDRWRWANEQMLQALNRLEKEHNLRIPHAARLYYQKVTAISYGQGPFYLLAPLKCLFTWLAGFFKLMPREPIGRSGMNIWAIKTTALACENFMLAMRAEGFDTCPMEGLDSARVKKILGLGSGAQVVMGLACGERAAKGIFGPRIRFERSEFIKII